MILHSLLPIPLLLIFLPFSDVDERGRRNSRERRHNPKKGRSTTPHHRRTLTRAKSRIHTILPLRNGRSNPLTALRTTTSSQQGADGR
ncbi:hypothetical protein SAICODRAFT_28403 [Saitoella complicata NRRL Y-17804]|uniref:uncharacterized protein n=1 Tax=Saitoella complicata (strain BCRC 22490 / CBS 7301 / JCM 7358 / NBRC 10748 / NRRL Y-17804) TaxID=698492 RepID=UPI000866ABBE|nr:uncharacterized protein SAICODRAFT_28403 [Saitoella complicata NRRL Y-17804]ODQ56150.1 hypothetical protein SAICODRAFT_28403 [Saitoella complicata NRRL Y-17804]